MTCPSNVKVSAFSWWRHVGLQGYNLPLARAALEAGARNWPGALTAYGPADSEEPWHPLPVEAEVLHGRPDLGQLPKQSIQGLAIGFLEMQIPVGSLLSHSAATNNQTHVACGVHHETLNLTECFSRGFGSELH